MATIGDLVVNLAVNAAGFATGFNTGSKLVGTFASVTEKSLGTIVGASQAALDTVSKTSVQLVGAIGTAVEKSLGGVAKVVSAWRKGSAEIALANAKAGTEAAKSSLVLARIKEPKESGGKSSAAEAVAAPVPVEEAGGKSFVPALMSYIQESKSPIAGFVRLVGAATNPVWSLASSAFSFGKGLFKTAQGLAAVDDIPAPFAPVQTALDTLNGSLAGIVTPSIKEFNMLLYDVADMAMSFLGPTVTQVDGICQNWGETLRGWVSTGLDLVYDALVGGVFLLSHWKEVGTLAATQVQLTFVAMGNDIAHFFTSTLPVLFDWFGKNWFNMFETYASFVHTVFENIAENIVGVMKGIWDFIASGGTAELEIAWTPLLDGFKNTVEALPDLPKRVASDLERTLTTERDRLAETIGGGMQDAIANAPGRRRTLPTGPETPGTPDSLMSESAGKRSEQNAALMRGSAEAVTALVTAANGNRDPVAEANQKALEEQLAEAKKQNDLLSDIKGELKGQGGMQTVRY